ncbi:hypothetical protein MSAN_01232900 [Mycena sanguinolenta]|uniref:F-box domain-containing protein n=1 Tax=Mycena sanguinolenta TaxID=230812 RepID=A0A8H6YJ86_9AGAR|nr:hypothetical protein MSAN_01232900 [Mycena sanguinolenta]
MDSGTLAGLPNELIIQILDSDPTSSQVARSLAGSCRRFHAFATPFLFRDVRLHSYDSAMMFFSVVFSQPSRAEYVRSLTMPLGRGFAQNTPDTNSSHFINDRWGLNWAISQSLKRMLNLEHLTFNYHIVDAVDYHNILERHTFPCLTSCELDVPGRFNKTIHDYDLLASFWARHPTLTRVFCPDFMRVLRPSLRISMPNLRYLEASPNLVPLLDSCALREIHAVWYPWQASASHIETVMLAMQSMTTNDIPFVASHDFFNLDACCAIVDSVSRNLPSTRVLRMRRIGQYNELQPLDNTMISPVTEYLSKFSDLMYFGIENRYRVMLGRPTRSTDYKLVEAWGNACPTLVACCLNSLAWVKLEGEWNIAPLDRFYDLVDAMHMEIRTPVET